jgi:methylenetetrahydrofolate dehydrogenase (NADP+)/methenyltetrahydrofolate cyclohydrolase
MNNIIDGKALAKSIRETVAAGVAELSGEPPLLVAVEVGHDEASASYTRSQAKRAAKLGIDYRLDSLSADADTDTVVGHLTALNSDSAVTAVMLQMPLPSQINKDTARCAISPEKDVEAVTDAAAGRLLLGTHDTAPCTALAALTCLEEAAEGDIAGLDVAIVGRSDIVGKPLALLLLHRHATVTICHTRTKDLQEKLLRADAVIAAAGRADLIGGDMIRPGALVIDVGTNSIETEDGRRLVGDVKFEEAQAVAGAITPVPGGVGPVTVAILMRNVLALARRQRE